MISRAILVKTMPFLTSAAPFCRLIWLHLEWPDIEPNTIGREDPRGVVLMPLVAPDRIRNVAVVGHGGSGKTTLVETLLNVIGATTRLGKVDDGTSILDTDPEEHRRHITINVALAQVMHDGMKINFIDTPGFADFAGDQKAGLRVADSALVVVDASAGVQVGTQLVWRDLDARTTPRVVVVSRLDRDNADFDRTLQQLREAYGIRVVPLHPPVGEHQALAGTIDLLHGTVLKGPKDPIGELPESERERVGEYRRLLVEAIVETKDDLMERYLEGKEMSYDELRDALHAAVREGKVIPVVATSSTKKVGFSALLATIVEMLPSPVESGAVIGTSASGEVARKPDPAEKLSAFVFKTLADPFVGKLSYVRVYSGTLHHNAQVFDALKGETERVGQVFNLRGKEQEIVDAVGAGDICAVPKLSASVTNSTLCDRDAPLTLGAIEFPEPSFSVAIEPASKADLDKLGSALHKLTDEDPTLHVRRDDATHETILSAIGESAIEVAVHHLKDKFGVQVETRTPRVPYRESIRGKASAQGRYKKQTGGHGQFGDVWLSIEPLSPGSGVEFATKVVGGSVPKNFFPAVEKGVREQAVKGVLAGYPLSDFKATLYDGSYHTVDSSEMSFKIAGSLALQNCVKDAQPYLLEPVMELEVIVPEEQMGDVLSDLNGRRGRVLGMDSAGAGHQRIRAHVPMAEIFRYATDLRSMTGGRGVFTAAFLGYEECPSHIAQKVIAEHETAGEKEPAGAH
ncbi:MAG TPA: elongation factor G [Candidatus Limnocylindria bacterium]|nr:elongation factor G [Candidatus Limnocylindria bacterium]